MNDQGRTGEELTFVMTTREMVFTISRPAWCNARVSYKAEARGMGMTCLGHQRGLNIGLPLLEVGQAVRPGALM